MSIKLLVSVRSPAEALAALEGGADIIDVKEPSRGSLGMADPETIQSILTAVAGRAPVSAALGELSDSPHAPTKPDPDSSKGRGISPRYAKLGLANSPHNWQTLLSIRFNQIKETRPIAAAYADVAQAAAPLVGDVLEWAIRNNAAGILIDTFIKDGHGLFDWVSDADLLAIIQQARGHRLLVALAGSLRGESLTRAMSLGPDVIAVRGAACSESNRLSKVDANRVRQLADLIAAHNAQPVLTGG